MAVKVDDLWVDPWKDPVDVRTRHTLKHLLPRALVLAWDGEPVREAQPYMARGPHRQVATPLKGVLRVQHRSSRQRHIEWLRESTAGLGTLVLLDADGREVSDD